MTEMNDVIEIDSTFIDRFQLDDPIAIYTKGTLGRVEVILFNALTQKPEYKTLKGDPSDPKANKDNLLVKIYDEKSHAFFVNINKALIEEGKIVPYKNDLGQVQMLNALTDDEIDDILSQAFFTLKAKVDKLTSVVPLERILIRAKEMNKTIKTIEYIQSKIAVLQAGTNDVAKKTLEDHYKNIQV